MLSVFLVHIYMHMNGGGVGGKIKLHLIIELALEKIRPRLVWGD
jgi:hypothetical protein